MIVVLLAHCIVSGVRAEKIRESIVQSLMEQPTQFSPTPFSAQGATGTNIRRAAAGSCSSPEMLPRVVSRPVCLVMITSCILVSLI